MSNAIPSLNIKTWLIAASAVGAGAILHSMGPTGSLGPEAVTATLIVATVLLWSSGVVSEALATLMFFSAAVLLHVAPAEVIFSGFGSSAFWMIFSGLIIGAAIKSSGLSARIAARLAGLLGRGHTRALAGASVFGLFLAFLVPSAMGRIVLIIPILQDLSERLGLPREGKDARGILLAGILGTALPSTAILPSNIPNNVLASIYEHLSHQPISYSDYLLLHFPVLGAIKTGLLIVILAFLYRSPSNMGTAMLPRVEAGPFSPSERRLSMYLGMAILFWLTDGIHHVSPAWVGLAAATVCLLPVVGVLPGKALQSINLEPLIFVSGVVGLGALISHSGLGGDLAGWVEASLPMPQTGGMENFLSLCGLSTVVGVFTTLPGVPAVLTPLTDQFARMSGLPNPLVLASQVVGFSTLLFPYQSPPLVAALQLTSITRWEMTRIVVIVAVLSVAFLWPLDYLWLSIVAPHP